MTAGQRPVRTPRPHLLHPWVDISRPRPAPGINHSPGVSEHLPGVASHGDLVPGVAPHTGPRLVVSRVTSHLRPGVLSSVRIRVARVGRLSGLVFQSLRNLEVRADDVPGAGGHPAGRGLRGAGPGLAAPVDVPVGRLGRLWLGLAVPGRLSNSGSGWRHSGWAWLGLVERVAGSDGAQPRLTLLVGGPGRVLGRSCSVRSPSHDTATSGLTRPLGSQGRRGALAAARL